MVIHVSSERIRPLENGFKNNANYIVLGKLSQERLQLLQSIGFEERIVPTNKTWEESFELLLEFRQQHGHAHVPKPNKTMSGDEHSLSVWADRQRMYYHTCFLEKKVSPLTKKRVKQLRKCRF